MRVQLDRLELRGGEKLLIYGIGNPGRQDDGLGVRLIERLETAGLGAKGSRSVRLESAYQLNIEDAWLISEYDVVVFVDASAEKDALEPFSLRPLQASGAVSFTTHAMGAESVLSLCEDLYQARPRAYMLALPGYEWGVSESLSPKASRNLEQAFSSLSSSLMERSDA